MQDGILRAGTLLSDRQTQTAETFGFKWRQRKTFESAAAMARTRAWEIERYGDVANAAWWSEYGEQPLLLDAGCGAGLSATALLEPCLDRVRYLGTDVSAAVDVAAQRFAEAGHSGAFMQADLMNMPLAEGSVDVILSEGVLHHTDSTEDALGKMTRLLKPGGRFMFYVYRRKGPIREFTDDHVRDLLQAMSPEEAWEALMPLTKLGIALGELGIEVDVPEEVSLLEIPAGPIDLQRLFYWHVFKAYHHPDLDLDEANHINYDWYAPRNAHRQSPEEVRAWCEELGLDIEREDVQEAGITVIAKKGSS
ncbi:MAG: class I SAM-dependent methyltransferase [Rubrobacteraceae bacterium]|nr:class I SAM-dependent methyltransferase [Rubrobacteraceae bacterium]